VNKTSASSAELGYSKNNDAIGGALRLQRKLGPASNKVLTQKQLK